MSFIPSDFSSWAICRVTIDRAMPFSRATAEKLPSSATRTNMAIESSFDIVAIIGINMRKLSPIYKQETTVE
jgi:hypothetical protein